MARKLAVTVACALALVVIVQGAAGDSATLSLTPDTFSLDGGAPASQVFTSGWGGQVLQFSGTAADTSGQPQVTIGSQPCVEPATLTASGSAFTIQCDLPVLTGTGGPATVTLAGQTATGTDLAMAPTRPAAQAISGCEDAPGGGTGNCPTTGGVQLTLQGSNLPRELAILVGGSICEPLPYVDAATRQCILPPGTGTEPVTLVSPTGPVETGLTVGYHGAVSTPLAAPSSVQATAADGQATVSWSTAADPTATGFRVTPSTPQGPLPSVTFAVPAGGAPATMSGVVGGLANGVATTFTVAAVAGSQTSPESAASAAVVPAGLPGAPTGVTARDRFGEVDVSWSAPATDGGSPVTGYTVTAYRNGAAATTATTAGTSAQLTLPTGVYTFTVAASNAVGAGPASAPSAPVIAFHFGR